MANKLATRFMHFLLFNECVMVVREAEARQLIGQGLLPRKGIGMVELTGARRNRGGSVKALVRKGCRRRVVIYRETPRCIAEAAGIIYDCLEIMPGPKDGLCSPSGSQLGRKLGLPWGLFHAMKLRVCHGLDPGTIEELARRHEWLGKALTRRIASDGNYYTRLARIISRITKDAGVRGASRPGTG